MRLKQAVIGWPVSRDVLEADEGLGEHVQLVDGGVDVVETATLAGELITVGDGEEEPVVDLEHLPVRSSDCLRTDERETFYTKRAENRTSALRRNTGSEISFLRTVLQRMNPQQQLWSRFFK